jgi:holliday junction DNA helicase RuvB
MGFWEWLVEPFTECLQGDNREDVGAVKGGSLPTAPNNVRVYRPDDFDSYIGQEKAKNILKAYISAIKERGKVFPHLLIHGKAGCGKTTLAKIVAKNLGVAFEETITSDVSDIFTLQLKIGRVNGGVLFLDEVHGLDRATAESIYSIMEDFAYNGRPIQEFTLIGATTEIGEIMRDRRPFYDRFKIIIELEDYTPTDLSTIAHQYKEMTFPIDMLKTEVYTTIGKNCRGTPRTAIRLVEATIYLNGDVSKALYNFDIIKDGFTSKDLKLLKYIAVNEKGVGLQGIASYLGTAEESYLYEIEPYLLTNNLIIRSPRGRKITIEGLQKIKELEDEKNTGRV